MPKEKKKAVDPTARQDDKECTGRQLDEVAESTGASLDFPDKASTRGELLSALDLSVLATIPCTKEHTFVLQGKTVVAALEADGSLRVQYTVLLDDLSSQTQLVQDARSHELEKRHQDLALAQEDLQRLQLKLRQDPVEDEDWPGQDSGEELLRLNQIIGNHTRQIARLERPELEVQYTETAQTASFKLPPGLVVRAPALFSPGALLWCPLQEPSLTARSQTKVAKVGDKRVEVATATYALPRSGRAGALCASTGGVLYVNRESATEYLLYSFDTSNDKQGFDTFGSMRGVTGVAHCRGQLYLTGPTVGGLCAMQNSTIPIRVFPEGGLGAPYGLCASEDLVFVTDRQHNCVRVLRPRKANITSSCQWVQEWGRTDAAPGEFNSPGGLAYCQSKAWVLVADTLNHRVQVFFPNGTLVTQWGRQVQASGTLNQPLAVACCQGLVFVSDSPGTCRDAASGLRTTPALAAHGDRLFVSGYEDGRVHEFRVGAEGLGPKA